MNQFLLNKKCVANLFFLCFLSNMQSLNVNFRANLIAKTSAIPKKGIGKFDIYELNSMDRNFIKRLGESVNFDKSMPNLSDFDKKRLQNIFDYGIESAQMPHFKTFLAINDNKPCSFMVIENNNNRIGLDCICNIPVSISKFAKGAGKSLLTHLFKYSEENNAKSIDLFAVTNGPFNVIEKYKKLGFLELGWSDKYIQMSCNKYKIKEQLKELLSQTCYKPIKNSENIDLDYFL